MFTVTYEGYLVVNAVDEDTALKIANSLLSDSGIVNDGDSGEWELTSVSNEEGEY
jgi:hypothetical protein